MLALLKALRDKVKEGDGVAGSLWEEVEGRVYLHPGPPRTEAPYLTYSLEDEDAVQTMTDSIAVQPSVFKKVMVPVRIRIWSSSSGVTEAATLADLARELFHTCTLTFSGGDWVSRGVLQTSTSFDRIIPYWVWDAVYTVYLERVQT